MSRWAVWFALGFLVAAPAQERVQVAVSAPAEGFVGELLPVAVTIAFDGPWLAEHGIALTRQQVDLPLHVDVPWLTGRSDVSVALAPAPSRSSPLRLAVGDRIVDAGLLPERTGSGLLQAQLNLSVVPLAAGQLTLPPVHVRYAYASEFREHLLRGREPVDRRDASAHITAPVAIAVRALPTPAPAGFFGAVGEFSLAAAIEPKRVRVGEVLRVTLTLRGHGDLRRSQPMPVPELPGFHVEGIVERDTEQGRNYLLDVLALRAGVDELPPLPVVVFEPERARYVELHSPAVPLEVLPATDEAALPERVRQLIAADRALQPASGGLPRWLWRIGFGLLALLGVLLFRRGQRLRHRRRRQDALHALRTAVVGDDAAAVASALERALASAADCEGFAVPLVWDTLRDRGVAVDIVLELQELHTRLDAARFGGELPAREDVLAAVGKVLPD